MGSKLTYSLVATLRDATAIQAQDRQMVPGRNSQLTLGFSVGCAGWLSKMFFFFSNRLGCLGSILVSAAITIALLLLFGVFR
jgi:hypothetical protein